MRNQDRHRYLAGEKCHCVLYGIDYLDWTQSDVVAQMGEARLHPVLFEDMELCG
jgi:hypothetical protein